LGLLELIVSLVQAFVFSILIVVYLEERFSH
jgi:F0F1-type ATP synthase membrane subunit a